MNLNFIKSILGKQEEFYIPQQPTVRPARTKTPKRAQTKNKNTYTIHFNVFVDLSLFELCRTTPMTLDTKNGEKQTPDSDWLQSQPFPNPSATTMARNYNDAVFVNIFGQKLATTIIEYLDKDTKQPVLYVFPTTVYINDGFEANYQSRLNHASRRDLEYQLNLRRQLLEQYQNQFRR